MNGSLRLETKDLIVTSHDKGNPRSRQILGPILGILPQAAIIVNGRMMLSCFISISVWVCVGLSSWSSILTLVPVVRLCVQSLSDSLGAVAGPGASPSQLWPTCRVCNRKCVAEWTCQTRLPHFWPLFIILLLWLCGQRLNPALGLNEKMCFSLTGRKLTSHSETKVCTLKWFT